MKLIFSKTPERPIFNEKNFPDFEPPRQKSKNMGILENKNFIYYLINENVIFQNVNISHCNTKPFIADLRIFLRKCT